MGNVVGRVLEAVCTLGISELVRTLTPAQQQQVKASQDTVDAINRHKDADQGRHDVKMGQNREAERQAADSLAKANAEIRAAQQSVNTTKTELDALTKKQKEEEEGLKKLQKLTEGDLKTFNEAQEYHYKKQLEAVEKLPQVQKTSKNSCAFMGKTSTGKSSAINRLFGTKEKTSPVRCTADIKPVCETDKVMIFDVFGENDEESYHNMETLTMAKSLHKVCIVYTESVDSVLKLARLTKALKVDKVYVRNKSEDLTPEEIVMVLEHDTKKIQEVTGQNPCVVLASAKTGMGMNQLMSIVEGGPVPASVAGSGSSFGTAGGTGSSRSSPY